jgi:hypothetical protein
MGSSIACSEPEPLALAVGVLAASVTALVQLDHLARGLVQAIGAVSQFGMRAAALLAGVGGQLHAVDGKARSKKESPREPSSSRGRK